MMRLIDKTVLITGAGNGIGKATALRFAEEGAYVAVTDLDHDAACDVAKEIVEAGRKGFAWKLDVADANQWDMVVREVSSVHGTLDVLVNNAGIAIYKPFNETTAEDWAHITSVNLDSIFLGCKAVIPYLNDKASIINISSTAGIVAMPNGSAYNATKGGVRMLTKGLAVELAKEQRGIRVNSVHPGGVNTELFQKIADADEEQANELQAFIQLHPLGRLAEPYEIANAILFLASDEASFITGSELVIDGGYTAQ